MAGSVWNRHGGVAGRNSLDRGGIRPMALGFLEEGEQLDGLRRCAKDHAP